MPAVYRFQTTAVTAFSIEAETEEQATALAQEYLADEMPEDFAVSLFDSDDKKARAYPDHPADGVYPLELTDIWPVVNAETMAAHHAESVMMEAADKSQPA